jgi:hypothetical protein
MAAGDLHALKVALITAGAHGKVCCHDISCTSIPALLGGLLNKGEAGHLDLWPCPTHQQWECCLKIIRELWWSSLLTPITSRLAPSSSPYLSGWTLPCRLLRELQILVKKGVSCFGLCLMGLSEFPDTLLLASDIVMEAFVLRFLWCRRQFPFLHLLIIACICALFMTSSL